MRRILSALAACCLITALLGQEQDVPYSLDQWITSHIDASLDSLVLFSELTAAHRQASQKKDALQEARLASQLGALHFHFEKMEAAEERYTEALELYAVLDRRADLAEIHLELEMVHKYRGEYSISATHDFTALAIYEAIGDHKGIARCYTNICDLQYYEERYAEGIEYCDKAIAIQAGSGEPDALAKSYRYRADNELQLGEYEAALASTDSAIALLREVGRTDFELRPYFNTRGNVLKFMQRYDEALAEYQKNYQLTKDSLSESAYLVPSIANIGHVYLLQERHAEAIPYNLEAVAIMTKSGNYQNLWENYMHLSNSYQAIGDFENALTYANLYSEEHDIYLNNTIANLRAELLVKYETEKKEELIDFQQTELAQQQKINFLMIGIGSLLLLILGLLMYFNMKRKKRNKELAGVNDELDKKNAQNELLLKEIHHRVKNNLAIVQSLISLQSARMDDSAGKEAMIASKNRVHSMGIIHERLYQSDNLGAIEMKEYFENLSEGLLDAYGARDRIKIDCAMDELELDVDTAIPIGLIVNELLTNAMKYAFPEERPGKIKVALRAIDEDGLALEVSDDGVGKCTPISGDGSGFGSKLIDLLTKQLNGQVEETQADGTTVSLELKKRRA